MEGSARRCEGAGTSLAKSADNRLGVTVNYCEQHTGRPIWHSPPLFPFLHRPDIEPETVCELLVAQLHSLAKSQDVLRGRVVDDATGKRRRATHMGERMAGWAAKVDVRLVADDGSEGNSEAFDFRAAVLAHAAASPPVLIAPMP